MNLQFKNITPDILTPVNGYSNQVFTMYRFGRGRYPTYFIQNNDTGTILATGRSKHCVEVWNNTGTVDTLPMVFCNYF
jgi:hypothetical protein